MVEADLILRLQGALKAAGIPAWLFYGFKEIDPIAISILNFDEGYHCTRRWFYLVPAEGGPTKLVHRIESGILDHLPGKKSVYLRWQEFQEGLKALLEGRSRVAMQYSGIPYISRVDGGTIDSVRNCGVEVVSSENLVQAFQCVWRQGQLDGHRRSALFLTETVEAAYGLAADRLRQGRRITEAEIQIYIMDQFHSQGYVTDSPPIVGVDSNAGDPHYSPSADNSREVVKDSLVLIDLWCKENTHAAVFADITWTGYFGKQAPQPIRDVFSAVTCARDRGVELLRERFTQDQPVAGWEVDDAVRAVIEEAGYGEYFVHRTGHNLGEEIHANGVNFDNLETHDTRQVIRGIGCTIEPGVYLPEFGIRSEINVYMGSDGPEITTPPQKEFLIIEV